MLKELILKKRELENEVMEKTRKHEEALKPIENEIDLLNEKIIAIIESPIKQVRTLAGKDTGTIDVVVDGVGVKQNIPKKVIWDQGKLYDIWNKIVDSGDEPENYMTIKTTHGVAEKAYDSFPEPVKKIFEDAREVVPGKAVITFKV